MNIFDIIGPVMIGPSSSHTAGAVRMGRIAGKLLGKPAVRADILLHGSFAKTYKGHGTDKALVGGILDMPTYDARIKDSFKIADARGLHVDLRTEELEGEHPNTAVITLWSEDGDTVQLKSASTGGGSVLVTAINGMPVNLKVSKAALLVLHNDKPGAIAAVTNYIGGLGLNICNFSLSRQERGGQALMTIETDEEFSDDVKEYISGLPNVLQVTAIGRDL